MKPSEPPRTCGAKTRKGTPCQLPPMPNGRCYRHGGATPSGVASPHFKHGRYSRDLPTHLVGRYEAAQEDRRLLELRDEIALVTLRLQDVLRKAGFGSSSWLLGDLSRALAKLRKARQKGDAAGEEKALARLEELAATRRENRAAWREVRKLVDQRSRLVQSERRRLRETEQMIPAEEAVVLVAALMDAVQRHVSEPAVRAAIVADIRKITGAAPSLKGSGLNRPNPP